MLPKKSQTNPNLWAKHETVRHKKVMKEAKTFSAPFVEQVVAAVQALWLTSHVTGMLKANVKAGILRGTRREPLLS